jgi:hypothetical protein
VDLEPVAPLQRARDGDLGARAVAAADAPERRGGAVAQHGPRADERRRHPRRLAPQGLVADRVHAPVHGEQSPFDDAMVDGAAMRPEREELPTRDHAMLPSRQRATASSRRIRPLHPMLWSRSNASDTSPIVPPIPCRRNHPTAPKLFAHRTGVRAPP